MNHWSGIYVSKMYHFSVVLATIPSVWEFQCCELSTWNKNEKFSSRFFQRYHFSTQFIDNLRHGTEYRQIIRNL